MAVATPVDALTVAIPRLDELQVNVSPATRLPFPSLALAVKALVRPRATSVSTAGVTVTVAVAPGFTAMVGSVVETAMALIVAPIVVAVPATRPVKDAV